MTSKRRKEIDTRLSILRDIRSREGWTQEEANEHLNLCLEKDNAHDVER